MNKIVCGLLVGLVLVGCASREPVMLSEDRYENYAKWHQVISECGSSGRMTPAIAAKGMAYLKSSLAGFSYYPERLQAHVNYTKESEESPSNAFCNQAAMAIESRSQQISNQNQTAQLQQNELNRYMPMPPKITNCNQIGTQVLCSTF